MGLPAKYVRQDVPVDMHALLRKAAELGMKVRVSPDNPELGYVFCQNCGDGRDVRIVLSRWENAPFGCLRAPGGACSGRQAG